VQKVYINDGEGIVSMVRYIYKNTGEFSHYQRLYYFYDSLGSVSVVAGENGLPLQNYTYSPYGSTINVEYDPVNNLRFVGRYGGYRDDDTDLTYFWHRWYDERDGRWVSRDPIQNVVNYSRIKFNAAVLLPAYLYVHNNSTIYIDTNGLFGTTDCSYYIERCNETGNSYYCDIAPFVCDKAGDNPWSNCARQCLQDIDRQVPVVNQCGKFSFNSFFSGHGFCFTACTICRSPY
jgi:RHS repeat-associated protein